MLGSYMCDTCPAILQDLRTLLGCRYMTLLTTSIVGRGDWLWNSENFKGLNNSAVPDVEQTRHVTLTAHKFIQDVWRTVQTVCFCGETILEPFWMV